MIRFSGRGFMTGWAGLGMIGLILITVILCVCCWCIGWIYNRRHPRPRRGDLATEGDLPVVLIPPERGSPKFIQILNESHEGERRRSTCYGPNVPSEVINPAIETALANPPIDDDRVCPYPPSPNDPSATKYIPMPTPMPM